MPGYSTFYCQLGDPAAFVAAINTFLTASLGSGAGSAIPSQVTIVPDSFVDSIMADSGELINSSSITPPATIASGNAGTYSAPAGACVTWLTQGFVGGHRVRGRTFLVPLNSAKFQNNGTLDDTFFSTLKTAANNFTANAVQPLVWHRPVNKSGGQAFLMFNASVKDKVAVLTSRR